MRRVKTKGWACFMLTFWLFAFAGCAPFADFKKLRRTVPWVASQSVPWTPERMASSVCPDISGVYRRGYALDFKFAGFSWRPYMADGIDLNPVVVLLQRSKEPVDYDLYNRLPATPLKGEDEKRRSIHIEAEVSRQQQAFYAKSIAHVSHKDHSLIIRVTDNEQYNKISSIDLRQAGIGCSEGMLVVRFFAGGRDSREGKAPRSVHVLERQFRVLPNGNLEVTSFDQDWYGENGKATDWKRSAYIYERIK